MAATFIDDATGTGSATTTVTITGAGLTSSSAGDVIIVCGASDVDYITGVSGRSGSWASCGADSGSHMPSSMWYGVGVSGAGDITVTFGTSGEQRATALSFSGLAASPLDAHAGLTSADDSPDTEVITPSASALIVACVGSFNVRLTGPTGGYTAATANESGSVNLNCAYKASVSAATSTGWTVDTSGGADTSIAAFLEGSSSGGGTTQKFVGGGFF